MGEYYGEPFQKLSKSPKNNMDEAEFIPKVNVKYLKRKKKKKKNNNNQKIKKKKPLPPKHSREQRKFIKKKLPKKNSWSILSGTFDFDPE